MFPGLDKARPVFSAAAVFAHSVNLESMPGSEVTVLASNLALDLPDFRGEKLDRGAALGAHHVVMAAPVVLVLVPGNAVVKSHFAGQAATSQKLQRPVHGSESDARVSSFYQAMQFVDRQVFASFKESAQDGVALFRLLQADALEVPEKNSFRFTDILTRYRWLIVDSFLQHVGWRAAAMPRHALRVVNMILGEH
jgi:hypothetical protein